MSDLISREKALDDEGLAVFHYYDDYSNMRNYLKTIPSADIMECARAIKEYCEHFSECEGCRFYKGLPFRCEFGICPQEWNLPEGEKK